MSFASSRRRVFASNANADCHVKRLSEGEHMPMIHTQGLTRQFRVKKEIVEAERALFAGNFAHPSVPIGALAAVAVAALGLWVGTRAMRRSAE
jgi:hypothetical protein